MNTTKGTIRRIAICGGGLAAYMTAATLARQFLDSLQITIVGGHDAPDPDLFYGSTTPPTSYAFNLSAGVSEPSLILDTDTAFSWGTRFVRWGAGQRSWMQCFHLPLPVVGGVLLHHYLSQQGLEDLEPFLTSAVAANHDVFAHPVEQKVPRLLARAEYGYQIDPQNYQRSFAASANANKVQVISEDIARVERNDDGIAALHLSDGQVQTADLYVDCTGPDGLLISSLGVGFSGQRRLRAALSGEAVNGVGAPYRTLTAHEFGWQAATQLQGAVARLTVFAPESETLALRSLTSTLTRTAEVTLGSRASAWSGNCVAIGHAACVLEPLTCAPMLLLQRGIERLLSLIPIASDMSVERREFNRQNAEDYVHAEIFNRALFETKHVAETPYWRAARGELVHEKLARKIAQFESRGLLVAFDLEPFNSEDWMILHYGMGRRPARHDRVADRAADSEVRRFLTGMSRDIEDVVKTLPDHGDYMAGLIRYLRRKKR